MTEVHLIHNGEPQGKWLSVEHMIEDLNAKKIQLGPGDQLIVSGPSPVRSNTVRVARDYVAEVIPFRRRK